MRSLDSVLFSLSEDTTVRVRKLTASGQRVAGLAARRMLDELSLVGITLGSVMLAAALVLGLAYLCRLFAADTAAAPYVAVLVVPVFAVLGSALTTIALRLAIEPRRVGALPMILLAACAYPAAWAARAWIVGATEPLYGVDSAIDWALLVRAAEISGLGIPASMYVAAEAFATTLGGLVLTRLYLGPQLGTPAPGVRH